MENDEHIITIAEDGTIIRTPRSGRINLTENNTASIYQRERSRTHFTSETINSERRIIFWVITLVVSISIGCFLGFFLFPNYAYYFFTDFFESLDMEVVSNVSSFLSSLMPYLILIGSVIGTSLYNKGQDSTYEASQYILSILSAIGGSVAICIAVYAALIIIIIAVAILLIILAFSVLFGG